MFKIDENFLILKRDHENNTHYFQECETFCKRKESHFPFIKFSQFEVGMILCEKFDKEGMRFSGFRGESLVNEEERGIVFNENNIIVREMDLYDPYSRFLYWFFVESVGIMKTRRNDKDQHRFFVLSKAKSEDFIEDIMDIHEELFGGDPSFIFENFSESYETEKYKELIAKELYG